MSKPDWATRIQNSRQRKFDEGFEAGAILAYDLGRADEQSRIVKLLQPLGCPENGVEHDCQNGLGYTTAADLIALIKGETE